MREELRALSALQPLLVHEPEPGGVGFRTDRAGLYAANLQPPHRRPGSWCGSASFHAATFYELERHAGRLPWERFVAPGQGVEFRVTPRKSKLYHQDAVAERLTHRRGRARARGVRRGRGARRSSWCGSSATSAR